MKITFWCKLDKLDDFSEKVGYLPYFALKWVILVLFGAKMMDYWADMSLKCVLGSEK